MKQDAVFVNVGRGSLVNDRDILQVLDEGQIGGAILDVTQEEPLPADDPLWDHEQVIITPHAAGTFANDACWKTVRRDRRGKISGGFMKESRSSMSADIDNNSVIQ